MNNSNEIITPDSLKKENPIQVPPVPQDTTNYGGIISGVSDSIANDYTARNNELLQAQNNQNQTAGQITDLLASLSGRTQAEQNAQEQAGVNIETQNVNKITEQLLGLNSQASQLNRESQAIPLQVQQEVIGRGVTDAGIAPIQTARLRDNAIKALSIAQQSDIAQASLQGSSMRLQQAKDKAQQIVDLQFKPKEELITALKTQYDLNKDYLSSVDKKRSESLQLNIKRQEEELQARKENAKAISDMVVNASAQNAPADLIARANKAGSRSEAAMILGQYAGDYYKTELLRQQIATEKAQRSKIYSDISNARQALATKLNTTPALANEKIQASQDTANLANELKTLVGKSSAVGAGFKKSVVSLLPGVGPEAIAGTDRANYEAKVSQLKDTLASANLDKIKGAMSDKDIEFLRNIGTALNTNMSENAFDKELDKIITTMTRVPGVTPPSGTSDDLNIILDSVDKTIGGQGQTTTLQSYSSMYTRN